MKSQPSVLASTEAEKISLSQDAWLLRNFVTTDSLLPLIENIAAQAAFRHMRVPRGGSMSVAITNCGKHGWVSDTRGYRYADADPITNLPWPVMPPDFFSLAARAASAAGFENFVPDACLINCYETGARMGMHQDIDEQDFAQPIVSVSIGAPAVFMWGGAARGDPFISVPLYDGDVVVWGGVARKYFHGVKPLKANGEHTLRYNLTMRRAR
jgi:alkylated DNA repair protein (DNA oxidative demethylase)